MISASELMKKVWTCDESEFEDGKLIWKGIRAKVLDVKDLRSWFIKKNERIEKDCFMFTLKSGEEILNQGKLQRLQARAFREFVEECKKLKEGVSE